jgi:glutamine---fructose-6-phosphate transaminase (isomerizing)
MCGIFGYIYDPRNSSISNRSREIMDQLFVLSESRGKEASGILLVSPAEQIQVAKYALPASKMIRKHEYKKLYRFEEETPHRSDPFNARCVIGHSRLVTNGGHQIHANNQPVVAHGIVAVHNGIVTNVDELWTENNDMEQRTQVDTEVLLALIRKNLKMGNSPIKSIQNTYSAMEGAASLAIVFEDYDIAVLSTNVGSLYLLSASDSSFHIFASERYILKKIMEKNYFLRNNADISPQQIPANSGIVIDFHTLDKINFALIPEIEHDLGIYSGFKPTLNLRKIVDVSFEGELQNFSGHIPGDGPYILPTGFKDEYPRNHEKIATLRRCSRCVLPETMPFIVFDTAGVCNYCRDYEPMAPLGLEALQQALEPYRKSNGDLDCLVTFSGGRDSSYGVHFVKKILGMNPITYTYDWGMVTDLARRNQMRICGKLGVEHILVSADIAKKRSNIRANVNAWLKEPNLGTVPLFMAGDKQYFYYANQVAKQTGCKIVVLCENMLETTHFKSGFCGIAPKKAIAHTYTLTLANKFKLASYYGIQYLRNPAYLNASMLDTLGAYGSYYVIPHNYLNLFQYIKWDEDEIDNMLVREYNWETAKDTKNSWRIGDGTASFYNYIYYTMAGLTENDTFRSNQIREGTLNRDEAIQLIERDNQPRYETIQWYCDIVGLDFVGVMKSINAAQKLY